MAAVIRVARRGPPLPPPMSEDLKSKLESPTLIPETLADDLLEGAAEIARFIFGPDAHARRAHTAIAAKRNPLPHFQLGGRLYARKSVIIQWIGRQEARRSKSPL